MSAGGPSLDSIILPCGIGVARIEGFGAQPRMERVSDVVLSRDVVREGRDAAVTIRAASRLLFARVCGARLREEVRDGRHPLHIVGQIFTKGRFLAYHTIF